MLQSVTEPLTGGLLMVSGGVFSATAARGQGLYSKSCSSMAIKLYLMCGSACRQCGALALKWAIASILLPAVALSSGCFLLQESSIAAAAAVAAKQITEGVAANGLVKTESGRSPVSERAKPR